LGTAFFARLFFRIGLLDVVLDLESRDQLIDNVVPDSLDQVVKRLRGDEDLFQNIWHARPVHLAVLGSGDRHGELILVNNVRHACIETINLLVAYR